jgi:glycosyltransferase involved in cell wall biosynthesis
MYNIENRINVLHIIHSLTWGGAENQVVTLAPALNTDGYKIYICCLQTEGVQADTLREKGLQVTALNMRLRYWPSAVNKLYHLIQQIKPNIIHNHMYDASFWGTLVGKLAGVPVILTTEPGLTLKKRPYLFDLIINHFNDKMVAVSEEIRQYHIEKRVISPDKCITIPNAVDIRQFISNAPKGELKKQFGIESSQILIGSIGRLVQAKRMDILLQAARIVCDTVPQTRFLIIGDGPLRLELERKASELKLSNEHVKFLGNRQDVSIFLSALDIFVLSSETEGIPVSMLEAMAASRPVVTTRVGGIPQVIQDEYNGLLVSPNDPSNLAKAILELIGDRNKCESLAREAYKTIETHFSTSVISKQIISLYDNLLQNKTG